MAQRATITVNDREATPVARTFVPQGDSSNGAAVFCETNSVKIGERRLLISSWETPSFYKVRVRMESPILVTEVVNGVSMPKVARVSYTDTTHSFAKDSTLQERKNHVGIVTNAQLAAQTMVDATVTGLEKIW